MPATKKRQKRIVASQTVAFLAFWVAAAQHTIKRGNRTQMAKKRAAPKHQKEKKKSSILKNGLIVLVTVVCASTASFLAGLKVAAQLFPMPSSVTAISATETALDTSEEPYEEFYPEIGDPPYRIAVDAGHGGSDPGATGLVGECEMTARTAQLLTELLEADENYIPLQTRADYDTTATAKERVTSANEQGADLILSIHGNSAASEAAGFECYPVTPGRTWHEESMYFAKLLAAGMKQAGANLRGRGGVRYIYYNENDEKKIVEISDTSVHTEVTFAILEYAECPSVLAEQCFVTSETDVDQFGDEDGCALVAQVYYQAICAYFGTEPQIGS
jgi:N-acetylmuramoyl-L-alanine amidase